MDTVTDERTEQVVKFVSSVKGSMTPVGFYVIGIGGFAVGLLVFEEVNCAPAD